jgi:hypothetical protein
VCHGALPSFVTNCPPLGPPSWQREALAASQAVLRAQSSPWAVLHSCAPNPLAWCYFETAKLALPWVAASPNTPPRHATHINCPRRALWNKHTRPLPRRIRRRTAPCCGQCHRRQLAAEAAAGAVVIVICPSRRREGGAKGYARRARRQHAAGECRRLALPEPGWHPRVASGARRPAARWLERCACLKSKQARPTEAAGFGLGARCPQPPRDVRQPCSRQCLHKYTGSKVTRRRAAALTAVTPSRGRRRQPATRPAWWAPRPEVPLAKRDLYVRKHQHSFVQRPRSFRSALTGRFALELNCSWQCWGCVSS